MRPPLLSAGLRVDRYVLLRQIGAGGSGAVYQALDTVRGGHVALKLRHLPVEGLAAARAQARFAREARAAGEVDHPNVVKVDSYGIEGDLAFLAMELVQGETLAQLLKREGPLGVGRTLELMLPVCAAVARIHECGVVHRDIKPANILLGAVQGGPVQAKLADFGLSRYVEEFSSVTESGVTLGTPQYMAPEVTRFANEGDDLSDQYALGVVLYECLTGTRPFRGATPYELMHAVVTAPIPPPSSIEASVPPRLDGVLLRAMHRDPLQRYRTVEEFAEALVAFTPEGLPSRTGRAAARRPRARATRPDVEVLVHDGLALALRGDLFVGLWQAPARMGNITWQFDQAERFASKLADGVVALIILLPSSSPPDAATTLECIRRLRTIGPLTRRQSNVAIGGGLWESVVESVHKVIRRHLMGRHSRVTLSATIEAGIARALEKAGPLTPTADVIRADVKTLFEALGLEPL